MPDRPLNRYDVVIAGARCAGTATAMHLARRGLSVLVVDPAREGSDTLSTHALMRSAVSQLDRFGLLDAVRASGAPPIRRTTFHYGKESIPVEIKPKDGVDALYAPRRTVLDRILVDGAREAGAHVLHGHAVAEVVNDADGRVRGAVVTDGERRGTEVEADLVIGADGIRSKVARLVGAEKHHEARHAACSIYGYVPGHVRDGYHWHFVEGIGSGAIPTNDATCVFVGISDFHADSIRGDRLEGLYRAVLEIASPELAESVRAAGGPDKLRAFRGVKGYLRESVGPGWALVGDAGYFRDPITAHGISDAFREAELLTRAIVDGGLEAYQAERDGRVRGMLDVTDRIASFSWTLDDVKAYHMQLNREMNALLDTVRVAGVGA